MNRRLFFYCIIGVLILPFAGTNALAALIGNPLIARPSHDGADGGIFVLSTDDVAGGTVTDFGYYDNDFAGRDITPLLLRSSGTGFEIAGIGTTQTSTGGGAQSASFGLVSGTDQMGLGYALAWKDGSNGADNAGTPEWTNGAPGQVGFFGGGNTSFSVGDPLSTPGRFTRTYSVQATVQPASGELVGNVVMDRGSNDSVSGAIFILDDPYTRSAPIQKWVFFDNDTVGGQLTPLLLTPSGSDWEIIGIGTTRTSDASGAQYHPFGLIEGTNVVGPDIYFGFKDGSDGTNNAGLIDYDGIGGGPGVIYLGGGNTSFDVGDTFSVAGTFDRTYSVQAFAITPEPSTFVLSGLAVLGIGIVVRRPSFRVRS